MKPNFKTDVNILLRSIASTDCVDVPLFADDLDDDKSFYVSSGEVSGTAVHSLDTSNMEKCTEHAGLLVGLTS